MDAPARKQQESLMVTTQTIETLFKDEAVFQIGETEITIFPVPGYIDPESGHAAEFKDDPLDPSVKPIKKGEGTSDKRKNGATVALQALTGTGSDITEEAKKFMGVPYLFGTEPYEQSKRFDCSSFVQYVFEKFNYSLPRTARAQAGRGTFVQRSELRVGDLMFFYVPGRFKSDEEVGHVAIYLGNQKMIHSSPLPEDGVQISEINKDYWKQTFLYAKRILD
ncbi:C40 family peptidase [Paenibacillus sp. MAHUQ-46]|uniref:C40 family peptidase n=2 Tax=Paenibacillus TaxID=44249 RepID=A0A934IZM7_9BACL|nr:C40 family peptidase [Paenibacillus roseus]